MRDLNYQLKQLCRHCREGSYATQAKRERMRSGRTVWPQAELEH